MKTFTSLDQFAKHMQKVMRSGLLYEEKAANFIGESLVHSAKDSIGHLQKGEGGFESWQELADSTKADKTRKGYVFNNEYNPLLRTGELRDSIKYDFNPITKALRLGSNDQVMVWQELGTAYIPPRSVLGLTMYKAKPMIGIVLEKMLTSWLEDKQWSAVNWSAINGNI